MENVPPVDGNLPAPHDDDDGCVQEAGDSKHGDPGQGTQPSRKAQRRDDKERQEAGHEPAISQQAV